MSIYFCTQTQKKNMDTGKFKIMTLGPFSSCVPVCVVCSNANKIAYVFFASQSNKFFGWRAGICWFGHIHPFYNVSSTNFIKSTEFHWNHHSDVCMCVAQQPDSSLSSYLFIGYAVHMGPLWSSHKHERTDCTPSSLFPAWNRNHNRIYQLWVNLSTTKLFI